MLYRVLVFLVLRREYYGIRDGGCRIDQSIEKGFERRYLVIHIEYPEIIIVGIQLLQTIGVPLHCGNCRATHPSSSPHASHHCTPCSTFSSSRYWYALTISKYRQVRRTRPSLTYVLYVPPPPRPPTTREDDLLILLSQKHSANTEFPNRQWYTQSR
jgi:hypothetical protein